MVIMNKVIRIIIFLSLKHVVTSIFTFESTRVIVLLLYKNGLGNRLRSLADWSKIALLTDRKLLFLWKADVSCNITFPGLFQSYPKHIISIDIDLGDVSESYSAIKNIAFDRNLSFLSLIDNIDEEFKVSQYSQAFLINQTKFMSDTNVILTDFDGILSLEGISCQHYFYLHSTFYQSLYPVKRIRDLVTEIYEKYFQHYLMISIHVRVHDAIQDWEVIPPLSDGGDQAQKFGDGAKPEDFERFMKMIIEHFSQNSNSNYIRFFIASNNEEIKNHLLAKFPTAIAIFGDHDRGSDEGMRLALVDWLLISESSLIINTYGSSFAVEASMKKAVPILGVYSNKYLLHTHNIKLPYCGHMNFLRVSLSKLSSIADLYSY